MPTPIGHTLLGMVMLKPFIGIRPEIPVWRIYALIILGANFPDFDFFPGLLVGDINRYHQGISHSFTFALCFGLLSSIWYRWFGVSRIRLIIIASLACCSHLFMDYFGYDAREPFGMPLLWPFVEGHWSSSISLFSGVRHGVPGDDFVTFLLAVFSVENLFAVGKEVLSITPFLLLILLYSYFKKTKLKKD